MGRSRLGWAGSVAAPWCIAVGVLLSITAEAGQEPAQYGNVADRNALLEASDPVRKAIALSHQIRAVDEDGVPTPIVAARLAVGGPDDLAGADEIEPNRTLKDPASPLPAVDRRGKGDPLFGLRPGFDARARRGPDAAGPDALERGPPYAQDPRDAGFDGGRTMSPARPGDGAASAEGPSFSDGATPALPLDMALNSSTPTPSDGVLVVVEVDPSQAQTTVAAKSLGDGGQPNYAALIDPKDGARQMRCLAEAIYFESRGEPEQGQAAVAQVVLNRVRSGIYPTTVCGVVYQDRNRPFACQFSFACEGRSLRIEEPGPWAVATRIAQEVVSGSNYNAGVSEAVNYHANYVSPFWIGYLRKVDRIGNHIFYAMRDGVNWAPGALNGHGDRP
ncbi:MAG: cell wall hydrolase [Hyphomicrobiales bacterium]|nr:cell wall hydrolase [Hyphomicrobiales bacterium]MBV8442071.1 cell wall hydrolase [Hyphomicrobiales bacterium]